MSIFITNMPILNMNLSKNDIEIMKIVASHKTTTLPKIREEQKKQQMEKLRQNNWTYLKKLVEAGFVEKAGSEKKEGNQKKEGRRIQKYRLTKIGLNKIMPEFDSFDDFFRVAFTQYEKTTIENLENKLKQHEEKHNINRNLCFALSFKSKLRLSYFSDKEEYFDIVYRIAKSGPTRNLTRAERIRTKILMNMFIIEKNPKEGFQITMVGLYWVCWKIQLFHNLI